MEHEVKKNNESMVDCMLCKNKSKSWDASYLGYDINQLSIYISISIYLSEVAYNDRYHLANRTV
jgi:hypothetical protein